MGIKAIDGKGVNRAAVICDICMRREVVTCDYHRSKSQEWTPNEGQIRRKITAQGWSEVKGAHHCPACEAKRKAVNSAKREAKVAETKTASVPAIRRPTPEQEVDIIVALSSAYDRKAKRYTGQETDATVAEAVGGGCMPGWVAEIRAAKFGPAGNEEAEAIRSEIKRIGDETGKALAALTARLDALYRAEDKRVRSQGGPGALAGATGAQPGRISRLEPSRHGIHARAGYEQAAQIE
ncbi:hypothetical protein [Pseudogemmobacter sonorensis]|uniref:hypothetical protein n=1 Tax=Pseudogemmobacter sonorensis TaxID=2989681 RepID=UPI003687106B